MLINAATKDKEGHACDREISVVLKDASTKLHEVSRRLSCLFVWFSGLILMY